MSNEKHRPPSAVVDLEHARARLGSTSGKTTPESLAIELEAIRQLLDQGLSSEARQRLSVLLSAARSHGALLAQARCALSIALEMQGQFRESLDAVSMYEDAEMRAKLDSELSAKLQIQIALAYNYNRDHPKAIALLKSTQREAPEGSAIAGAAYTALARVYRTINEYPIARDYSHRALKCYRQTGEWRGLAETYFGLGIADIQAVNGQPAMGLHTRVGEGIYSSPAPPPGNAIADTSRAASLEIRFEILKSDGTPIGTIMASGLFAGASPPGAPSGTAANFVVTGGTGAFVGARGEEGNGPPVAGATITVPRRASVREDPANRRINKGARLNIILHVIPLSRPEIATSATGPAIFHSDFTPVTAAKPAKSGEVWG